MTEKTNVEDIIGLVQTDEPTDSVQLKKEAQLSICEKRVRELEKENEQLKQTVKRLNGNIDELLDVSIEEDLLKENEQLKSENKNLKSNVDDLMNMELEDRDIVCQAGKFRLEEWGKHRLHQFYDGDILLEDETVVIRLMDLTTENEQLKQKLNEIKKGLVSDLEKGIGEQPFVISMYLQSIIDLIGDVE